MNILKLFFIALSIMLFTSQSYAVSGKGLQEALAELQYSLSVEWDQKDKAFYDQEMNKFNQRVSALQAQGLTNEDMLNVIVAHTKNESLRQELSNLMLLVKINDMSQEEALKLFKERMDKTLTQGASWTADWDKIGTIVVTALVAFIVVKYVQCLADPNHITVCTDNWVCSYDSYYGESCSWQASCYCSH